MNLQTKEDYAEAKKLLKELTWKRDNMRGSDSFTQHMKMHVSLLEAVLLAYRRQHNIFEVGDKVVLLNWDNNSKIYSINTVYEHKLYNGSEYSYSTFIYLLAGWSFEMWFNNRKIRHASDEEIKAGRRL